MAPKLTLINGGKQTPKTPKPKPIEKMVTTGAAAKLKMAMDAYSARMDKLTARRPDIYVASDALSRKAAHDLWKSRVIQENWYIWDVIEEIKSNL